MLMVVFGLPGVPRALAATATGAAAFADVRRFEIPPQPLARALAAYGAQTGIQIAFDSATVSGAKSGAVSGQMTDQQALSRILASTGVTYRKTGSRSVSLVRGASTSIMLGPVRVGGVVAHQDPTGPGVGYYAGNTMAGTKTDTALIDIPNSIYVVTKQQMVDQQAQSVAQALRYSAGVYAEPQGTNLTGSAYSGFDGIKQRGFNSSQYVDGILSDSFAAGETAFLDRIEVVNGPASVMYGQTTPGGMVGMSLKKPTETPMHEATVGFGNWGRYEATFDSSDRITRSGNLRYRVAAIGVTQGTQMDYVNYQRVGVLPSLTWDIDSKTSLTVLGSYMYTPQTGAAGTEYPLVGTLIPGPEGRVPRHRFFGDPSWNADSARDAMFEYQFRHIFNKYIEFSQSFRWETSRNDMRYLYFSGRLSPSEFDRTAWYSAGKNRTVGLDSRMTGHVNTGPLSHTWIVGSDFRQIKTTTDIMFGEDDPIDIYHPVYNLHTCLKTPGACGMSSYPDWDDYFQEGLYFQDQIKWKGLSVLLGGRQDWVSREYIGGTRNYYADGSAATKRGKPSDQNQAAFTWRAGLVYKFDFGLAPYFSYATSFVPQTSSDWMGRPFAPLVGKQFEAGLKYQVPKTDVLLTASAFHINENHYLIGDPDHTNYNADAGRVTSKGVELSASANVTKDLHVVASYTYTDMRYARSNLTATVVDAATGDEGRTVSEQGRYVQGTPRNMMSLFFDYTLPFERVKGFGFNWGIRYVGFTYADAANSFKVPPYVLFDMGAHYDFGSMFRRLKGLRAQVAVSNLTNRYYVTSCGTNDCYMGQGRRVYGNLAYSW
ncbi:ferric siderophore receptor [Gluconacetobacter liquefaciens]|nr:ferric siderophore receptor [Gluconacetobacter liquefaciens]